VRSQFVFCPIISISNFSDIDGWLLPLPWVVGVGTGVNVGVEVGVGEGEGVGVTGGTVGVAVGVGVGDAVGVGEGVGVVVGVGEVTLKLPPAACICTDSGLQKSTEIHTARQRATIHIMHALFIAVSLYYFIPFLYLSS
jgi:hypothetical protein